jgi:hypothetical protein
MYINGTLLNSCLLTSKSKSIRVFIGYVHKWHSAKLINYLIGSISLRCHLYLLVKFATLNMH